MLGLEGGGDFTLRDYQWTWEMGDGRWERDGLAVLEKSTLVLSTINSTPLYYPHYVL